MCGIAGFTTFHKPRQDAKMVIKDMTDLLAPRGPDNKDCYVNSYVTLGHRRLSVIDLKSGAQPITIEGGRYQIVYNGEIYNYIELRKELEEKGRIFSTQSDSEVVLYQFAVDGVECLQRFNGMFAFALWDRYERRLFLARDRIGIKPLYYCIKDGELIFASELKALLRYPALDRKIDLLSLSKYLTFSFIPAPHTIFEHIHKLEPGTYAIFDQNGLRKTCYWDMSFEENSTNREACHESAQGTLKLLSDSVANRLCKDIPVGVFLSGGIDSSAITAIASRASHKTIHTFSIGFEESSYDESIYSKQVSQLYGTKHHHEILSLRKAIKMLPKVLEIFEEPLGDSSVLPTYLLSQFTSQYVKIVLGGDGGDELFAGYPSFIAHKIMDRISVLPQRWLDGLAYLAKRIPVSHSYASANFLVQRFFKGKGISPEIRFFLWMGAFDDDEKQKLLSDDVKKAIYKQNPYEDIMNYVHQSRLQSDFEKLIYLCTKLYLQDSDLVKINRISLVHSLEVRMPFLDHVLVEYISRIQSAYKLRGLTSKYIFKKAVRELLPKNIIHRQKRGFSIPVALWLEKDLRDIVEDLCSETAIKRDGWFNYQHVRRLLDDHFAHRKDNRREIWTLLSFLIWRDKCYGR